jgi:hypothetical protein
MVTLGTKGIVAAAVLLGCLSGCNLRRLPDPTSPTGGAPGSDGPVSGDTDGGPVTMTTTTTPPAGQGNVGSGECLAGSRCLVPASPCLVGATTCTNGASGCTVTAVKQANGTACGMDSVCLDGACSACTAGTPCPLPGKPCRAGSIDCAGGRPECVEMGNAPAGQMCGSGMVCKDGSCAACAAGDPCVPANPCHEGTLDCTGGVSRCMDTGRPLGAGMECGPGKVCGPDGTCLACKAGTACDSKDPCKTGKLECTSGTPTCVDAGDAASGKPCGASQVCNGGKCVSCAAGMTCTPASKCHTGTLSCAAGTADCKDANKNAPNGSNCGTNLFCNNGNCVPCTPDVACTTSNPCKLGVTSCATGAAECKESGNAPDGKSCGQGKVCNGGTCVACAANMNCEPSACKVGKTTCTSGSSECMETGNAPNGSTSSCGSGRVCNNGSCNACSEGSPCSTNLPQCKTGTTACSTGRPVCNVSGNLPDNTDCGAGHMCRGGNCIVCGGNGQPCCGGNNGSCSGGGVCKGGTCAPACVAGGMCGTNNKCTRSQFSCATGTQQCVSSAINEGMSCSGKSCRGGQVIEGRCSGGDCVQMPVQTCGADEVCMGNACQKNCGVAGKDCCPGLQCNGDNVECDTSNHCVKCGNRGNVCCFNGGGVRCSSGLRCVQDETCGDCGTVGNPCCDSRQFSPTTDTGCESNALDCVGGACVLRAP